MKNQKETKPPVEEAELPKIDWSKEAAEASGFEQVKANDLGIPFLVILQSKSPECDKSAKDHAQKKIEGAEQGDIVNTISRRIIHKLGKAPIHFIPCAYDKLYVEWKPREAGGGFVRQHIDDKVLLSCKKGGPRETMDILPSGNIIRTTAYFFGFLLEPDMEPQRAVIAMSSTQLKKARQWLNIASAIKVDGEHGKFTPPLYSHEYHVSTNTTPEQNDAGSWWGWRIETGRMVIDPKQVADGREVAKMIKAGDRLALPPAPEEPAGEITY